jgi:hypothetical protein
MIEEARQGVVIYYNTDEQLQAFFQRLVALVRADEREACAVLFNQPRMEYFGQEIQDAIRARGNT